MNPTRRRCILLSAVPLALLTFWFITAPAVPSLQRIIAGGPPDSFSRFLNNAAEAYEAPMDRLYKTRALGPAVNALGDLWWRVLDPPDTTP